MKGESLGDRMKRYEKSTATELSDNIPIFTQDRDYINDNLIV